MKLYWCPRTRASRVVWMLEEAGLAYERVYIDLGDPVAKQDPGFIAASPLLKVPALEDGDVRMADAAAIGIYLADRYSMGTLAPEFDDPRRGTYLFWMTYGPGSIEPAVSEKIGGFETNPRGNGWGDFDLMINVLEKGLEPGPWLVGDQFTAADVLVGGSVIIMRALGVLPESRVLQRYVERCNERPAYRSAWALELGWRSRRTRGTGGPGSGRGGPRARR